MMLNYDDTKVLKDCQLNNPDKRKKTQITTKPPFSLITTPYLATLPYLLPSHSCTRLLQLKFYDDNTNAYKHKFC